MPDVTFKHSGDLGDIVLSLPTVRALVRNKKSDGAILFLDPEGGQSSPLVKIIGRTRTRLNPASIDSLAPLLLEQSYIREVRHWKGEQVDFDLDLFRKAKFVNNWSDSHLMSFGLAPLERDILWLTVRDPIVLPDTPVVINRSFRYQSNHGMWESALSQIKNQCVFVGHPKEHEIFEYTFDVRIPYYPTPGILDLARVIAGCHRFIGNQSLPHTLAEGMKKELILETYTYAPLIFNRRGAKSM